jgi:putative transposase
MMARQYRLDREGALHHVMTRGVEKRVLFLDDEDRADFVRRLAKCTQDTGMCILAWTLMPNHIHFLTRTGRTPLSRFMQKLLTGYAVRFNATYERVGPLFQGRYKAILVQADAYFARLVRYIHLNPVRARIVQDIDQLGEYTWSGHAGVLDPSIHCWQSSNEVVDYFSRGESGSGGYLAYLSEPEELQDDAFDGGTFLIGSNGLVDRSIAPPGTVSRDRHIPVLGDRRFSEELLHLLDARKGEPAVRSRGLQHGVVMKMAGLVERSLELPEGSLRRSGGSRGRSAARELVCYCLVELLGLSLRDAAGYLGITRQGAYYALGRYRAGLDRNNQIYNDLLQKVTDDVNANA